MFKKLFIIGIFSLLFIPSPIFAQQSLQNVNGGLQNQSNSLQNTGTINNNSSNVQDNTSDVLTKNAGSSISIDNTQPAKTTSSDNTNSSKSDKGWLVILVIGLLILAFFVFSYWITSDKNTKPTTKKTKPIKEDIKPIKKVTELEVKKPKSPKKKHKTKKAHR